MSNTETTQPEQRKAVQVTVKPSIYQIAIDKAKETGTFPGRIIELALLKIGKGKA